MLSDMLWNSESNPNPSPTAAELLADCWHPTMRQIYLLSKNRAIRALAIPPPGTMFPACCTPGGCPIILNKWLAFAESQLAFGIFADLHEGLAEIVAGQHGAEGGGGRAQARRDVFPVADVPAAEPVRHFG